MAPGVKLRTPQDYMVAVLRLLSPHAGPEPRLTGAVAGPGHPFCTAPQPNGWPDRATCWAAPEVMLRRIDWAYGVAGRAADLDLGEVAEAGLGPLLRPATASAIQRAGSAGTA